MLGTVVGCLIMAIVFNKSYQWAIDTCNADNIGYSQPYRNQQTVKGITYYDCSSFIWYALKAGGFDVNAAYKTATGSDYSGNAITTHNEAAFLQALGFSRKTLTDEWKAGDILIRSEHTEMVYSGGIGKGISMGAHSARYPLQDQVSINTSETTADKWTEIWRYGEGGAGGYGVSIYVVCALSGNSWRESHINSDFNEVGGGGFGLFQWTDTTGSPRRTNLENWLQSKGYSVTSPEGQIEFLLYENDWIRNFGEYNTLEEFLKSNSTDIPYLTECFMRNWERPGVPALEERVAFANKAYRYILDHANDTNINSWIIKKDVYLTESEALNNAVMMYRYLTAGGGGGGQPTTATHKMPVWLMLKHL